ncbi:DUF262 domain-containing protein [Achromobacter sp. ACM05]|uniref:GmrSD restriction endonuclease domain-containing protein n=1 Tax=Achromobacter sp. ACM05 TaxID=2854776 RepID=UPI001C43817E|nr:DUF262 domain-containing protein [Achromobacter sp. ACM05]
MIHRIEGVTELTAHEDEFGSYNFDLQPPPDVVSFNELRSCADLVRLFEEGTLEIQPHFQREVVWKKPDQSRFIDSLVKQLPIPSMCFSLDFKTQKWQVVDGLQRMTAIVSFLSRQPGWRLSRLDDIDARIAGKTAAELIEARGESETLYRRVRNLSLPITVIRCDYSKETHTNYLFTIFHRLNAGGVRLNNQEIRNCIYSGPFNEMLYQLDSDASWKTTKNRLPGKGTRFRSVELILRFLALYENSDSYAGKMAKFLNDYMHEHRLASADQLNEKRQLFIRAATVLSRALVSDRVAKPPHTLIDAALVGIADNIDELEALTDLELGERLSLLRENPSLSPSELKSDTTATDKIRSRLSAAREIFG